MDGRVDPVRRPGAAALLCLLAVAVAVLNSIDGRRTVPTTAEPVAPPAPAPAPPPEPVRHVPTVKELVWPSGKTDSRWAVKTNPDRLTVLSESISLLQLGTATADAWELFATLRRPTGRGQVGLFFGHHENPRTGTATYELVRLVGSGEQLYLHRRVETYRLDAPLAGSKGDTNASVPVKGAESYALRLVVRNNRLAEVHLNGQPVPGLVNVPQWEPANGPFGAHTRTSDGVFSTLLFNDRPIPLLTEAGAQHPEKP